MANNYRTFSFSLVLNSKKEMTWCAKRLAKLKKTPDDDGNDDSADFEYTVFPNEKAPEEAMHLWIHDYGESGNLEHVAAFVQEFFEKFDPKGFLVMTWADFCDKSRIDEFGGGLAVVRAYGTEWLNEEEWINSHTKGLKRRNGS